jgi:hypothetical protein
MNEQVYKNLRIIKQNVDDHVEEYYEQILTLVKSLQHQVDDHLLTTFFEAGLLPYLLVVIASTKWDILIQRLKSTLIQRVTLEEKMSFQLVICYYNSCLQLF